MNRLLLTTFLILSCLFVQAQNHRPGLFIDCQIGCDFTYLKQELTFVNYMLNRQEADILVLATDQDTGAGGEEIQLVFIGQNQFEGVVDTTKYFIDPNATDAIEREQLVSELKKGLLQFIILTPLIDKLEYTLEEGEEETNENEAETKDPWDYWVFNIGGNGYLNGEASYNNTDFSGRIRASRVTDQSKFRFGSFYNYNRGVFILTTGEEVVSLRESYRAEGLYVKSFGAKWSAGIAATAGSSTFGNTDLDASVKPAIEFNLFPYDEVQTHRFTLLYAIGPEYYNFTDSTVYDKLEQTLLRHGVVIEFTQTKKWGNISLSIGGEQFLHNPRLYNAYLNPNIDWQIYKGLSLDAGGYFSFVRDRINIAKADITDEDILLQIKQLDTNFTYFSYFGVNFRIGSKFNNFVNPRFNAID